MSFEPINLTWKGEEFVIPAERALRCIASIEDVLTLGRLHEFLSGQEIPIAKIAMAFGVALRFAGARVTDDEVYNGMFGGGGAELQKRALEAVGYLQGMMIPPAHFKAAKAASKKPVAARRSPAASSRRSTRS